MKTNTMKKNILAALLVTSTLVVSGCTASAPAPSEKLQTKFHHDIGIQHMKNAIKIAAEENGWRVVNASSNATTLELKKIIPVKKTAENTRGRIWNKIIVDREVGLDVSITKDSYEININKDSQQCLSNYYAKKILHSDMKKLQKSISIALIPEVL